MNRYYCTECGKECVMALNVPEHKMPCCKGTDLVVHKRRSGKGDNLTAIPVKDIPEVKEVPTPVGPKPVTKLDVSSGPVTAKASK